MAAAKGRGGKKQVMKAAGKAPVTFQPGGLHRSTDTPAGQPIPAAKMQQALGGKLGPKAKKQAVMAKGMLKAGRQTAAANRSTGKSKGK